MKELNDMLRIVPQCEAEVAGKRCRQNGVMHLTLVYPTAPARGTQSADLCRTHATTVAERARKEGYTATLKANSER